MTPLGPEALRMRPGAFEAALRTQRPVKALLLDQTRIAGLGNIYADESLWAAGIHPARVAATLTGEQAGALLRQIKNVLRRAIRAGGTTFSANAAARPSNASLSPDAVPTSARSASRRDR